MFHCVDIAAVACDQYFCVCLIAFFKHNRSPRALVSTHTRLMFTFVLIALITTIGGIFCVRFFHQFSRSNHRSDNHCASIFFRFICGSYLVELLNGTIL